MDDNQENSELTLNHPKGKRGPSSSSCAECKRLKIRCSGATKAPFPCTSCIKRGVESVCPNGVVPERQRRKEAGEGDILRRRNQALTARIKELEAALAKATGGTAESPSSSGTQDSEATLKDPDDHALVESFGTLTIEDSGRTNWHGAHSPAINLLPSEEPVNVIGFQDQVFDESLPPELSLIAAAFPFTAPTVAATNMKEALRSFTPPYEEAVEVCDCFFIHAGWLGTPCTRDRFLSGIIVPLYAAGSWQNERPDVLALLFATLAVGYMFDQKRPQYDPLAFRMNKLCAAALALAKPIDRPTITSLEALQIHLFFHQLSDRPLALSRFWTLSSLAFRMAQSLGLHRDSRAWGLDPALDQRRRWLFWQLNFMDGVISLSYGRPRFFSPRHYDCPLPNESFRPDLLGFGTWRFQFLRDALIPVLEEAFSVQPSPTYATIMRLDKKIRDLPSLDLSTITVELAQMTAAQCMQLFCVGGIKKLALLYLHRRFLFEAANDANYADIMTHKYAYSVQAGFQTSIFMVKQLRGLLAKDPIMCTRLFFLWMHGFSALFNINHSCSITFATLLIKRPESEFAETALREMNALIEMYQKAGSSHRAQRCLVPMLVLRDKGQSILTLNRTGHTIKAPLDAHLETLLGGSPVVLKTNRGHCAYSDPVPPPLVNPPSVNTNYDLEALLGNEAGTPPKLFESSPPNINQPIDPMSFNWNQPLEAMPVSDTRVFEGMDDLVANYLRGQNGLFDAGQGPDWETLLDSGRTNWHGAHSPAINLLPSEEPVNVIGFQDQVFDESLPPELSLIAAAFPFTAPTVAATNMKEALRSFAPSYEEAVELCNCFFIHAAWLGTPCTRERFLAGIVVPLYAAGSWESERPDVLALFFASLAVGCMFDQRRPQYDPFAFRLNKLCAAALALAKPIDRPTITALEALQIHLFFHQLSDRPLAVSRLWTLSSLAFRMAQSLGLHRDSRAWGLDPALDQRRRWLFWQLNFMDGVIALSYGRPRFFSPRHYDCPLPNESFRPDLLGFGTWRFQFLRDALIPVLEEAFSVQPPPTYATIMRLDKKIRDLPTLDMSTISIDLASMTAPQCMQLFCVGGIKKLAILYLHRRFLFEAASDTSCADMMTHKYAYSVQAGFQTSLAMVKQLRGLFAKDPIIITLATLLIKRPESEFAETALREMNSIIEMYQKAGSSHRAQRCLVPMLVLRDKGQSILTLNRTGHTIKAPLDAHLETLLGGTPVVLKTNRGHCAYSDPVPPPLVTPATVDTNYDLEALLGNDGATPPKFFEASPPTSNQPIDPMSFNWNQPVQAMPVGDTRVFEGMDDLVANYLRGQNGLFDAGQGPDWETLLGTMT
ncbi:hypothetical protein PIIN_01039 [Serendipita indica DSM 11827]|uniref:Zn(2)-C6 fungal-type domain-containing protein n=1 Tax=Serendipita indica (strain DSM 11827) TaxID=1109443 RepID=G4T7B3_SERID|nr:hypothetical protein PIIN_01039 [Serendipita indica DSM 11827]